MGSMSSPSGMTYAALVAAPVLQQAAPSACPARRKAPVSRNAGTSQSSRAAARSAAPTCAASCPMTRANVPSRPWRCSLSMRSSNVRVSTMIRYSCVIRSAESAGMSAWSTLPSRSMTSTRWTENDTSVVTGTPYLLLSRFLERPRGRGRAPALASLTTAFSPAPRLSMPPCRHVRAGRDPRGGASPRQSGLAAGSRSHRRPTVGGSGSRRTRRPGARSTASGRRRRRSARPCPCRWPPQARGSTSAMPPLPSSTPISLPSSYAMANSPSVPECPPQITTMSLERMLTISRPISPLPV